MDILNARAAPARDLPAGAARITAQAFCRASGVSLGQVEREGGNNVLVRDGAGALRNYRASSVTVRREVVAVRPSPEFSPGHIPVGMPWKAGR